MADSFDYPESTPVVDKDGRLTMNWRQTFSLWRRVISASAQSGATADRPTKLLWVGRTYFDTTLGLPIWVQTVANPPVWIDAAGNPV